MTFWVSVFHSQATVIFQYPPPSPDLSFNTRPIQQTEPALHQPTPHQQPQPTLNQTPRHTDSQFQHNTYSPRPRPLSISSPHQSSLAEHQLLGVCFHPASRQAWKLLAISVPYWGNLKLLMTCPLSLTLKKLNSSKKNVSIIISSRSRKWIFLIINVITNPSQPHYSVHVLDSIPPTPIVTETFSVDEVDTPSPLPKDQPATSQSISQNELFETKAKASLSSNFAA